MTNKELNTMIQECLLDRAYKILKEKGPMRASDLGWELWGETTECPERGVGSHGWNKFCRPAGKVLNRLAKANRAVWYGATNCVLWRAR
mgnify:FL=1